MHLISVIIPVYNAGKYLSQCLDSLIGQTHRELEILLIDDGSTDNSGRLCDEYAMHDPRIRVFHKKNGGVSSARNLGLEIARGEWISFVDSDDYLDPNTYDVLLAHAGKTDSDIITFEYWIDYPDRSIRHKVRDKWYTELNRTQAMEHNLRVNSFPFTRFFRSRLVSSTGGEAQAAPPLRFDETIARGEDGLFNAQLIHRAETVSVIPDALYHYVQSEESACRGKFRTSQLTALKLNEFYEPFLKTYYPALLDVWFGGFMELLIMLYYDMYSDEADHRNHMKTVYHTFQNIYQHGVQKKARLKTKVKLGIFRISPIMFCKLHEIIWRGNNAYS